MKYSGDTSHNTLQQIIERVQNRPAKPLGVERNYAVLLPLIEVDGELHIVYEVRAAAMKTQPGEISFPGGKVENGENPRDAAIRETCEELGVAEGQVKLIGELDYIVSPHNFLLYAYVGVLEGVQIADLSPNPAEVDHLFAVPVQHFLDNSPEIYLGDVNVTFSEGFPYHLIPNGASYSWRKGQYPVYFYKYGAYVIWGMTARLTSNFFEIIRQA